ncbi:MAG: polyprenyl synthetase family protein [Desulfohalobiaceae bacterium]
MKAMLEGYRQLVEEFLAGCLQEQGQSEQLAQAMQYSLQAGGKRIRPVLCLAWAQHFGLEPTRIISFASALELIHTYSLVHDDLPAMDNDDLRRGRPSSHVQFGEALAILAGDGLLTLAFELMLKPQLQPDLLLTAACRAARAAGPAGMVGGQVLDMELTGQGEASLDGLKTMHSLKTGAMLSCSCYCGALLAGAKQNDLEKVEIFGQAVGLAFQVADDILDIVGDSQIMGKPVGSDQKQGKLTYPGLLGLEESKRFGQDLVEQATAAISEYQGEPADFLRELAQYIMHRVQ